MSDLIQKHNLRTIEWLNHSFENRANPSIFIWCIRPIVFFNLGLRIFFIFLKMGYKIVEKSFPLIGKKKTTEHGGEKIDFSDLNDISFLNILLYKKNIIVKHKKIYIPSKKITVQAAKKLRLVLNKSDHPLVSIVIPVYNKIGYTINCLLALQSNVNTEVPYEIIIINDNSTDETLNILSKVEGLNLINNATNLGFILSCMKGVEQAKGHYICFLNNDTEVQSNWLESLLETFNKYPNAGVVGSMLIYPNNQLQEAGGVIWANASGQNYGKLQNYTDPKYNFVRPVDYCSGASIIISKVDFELLGGFELDFIPAYYEDTDLCFAVRNKLKKQVLYQPKSRLLHYEGISAGTSTSSGMKRFQDINSKKFEKKWKDELQSHFASDSPEATKEALRLCGEKTIIVIDSYIPRYDRESGSLRLFHILKIFKQLNYHVIFVPDNGNPEEPYTEILQQMGIEVLYYTQRFNIPLIRQIKERLSSINIAWICRPTLADKYASIFKADNRIKIIYDTIDLHYIRLKREAELYPERSEAISWEEMQKLELKIASIADQTISITDTDKNVLEFQGVSNVETVPNIHFPYQKERPSYEKRAGILFIGSYDHKPNIDAVVWLCKEIMPIVWKKYPDIIVTLLGNNPKKNILAIASPNVIIPGFVEDVSPYFLNNRIFVAPLNYGSGMKGKIGQSLEYSLPVLSTSIGVEGMNLKNLHNCIIAEDTESFAKEIVNLYFDKEIWESISHKCHEAIQPYSPEYIKEKISKMLISL
jgi:GT2 family glycosyltransferase